MSGTLLKVLAIPYKIMAPPYKMLAAPCIMSAATHLMFAKDQRGGVELPPGGSPTSILEQVIMYQVVMGINCINKLIVQSVISVGQHCQNTDN